MIRNDSTNPIRTRFPWSSSFHGLSPHYLPEVLHCWGQHLPQKFGSSISHVILLAHPNTFVVECVLCSIGTCEVFDWLVVTYQQISWDNMTNKMISVMSGVCWRFVRTSYDLTWVWCERFWSLTPHELVVWSVSEPAKSMNRTFHFLQSVAEYNLYFVAKKTAWNFITNRAAMKWCFMPSQHWGWGRFRKGNRWDSYPAPEVGVWWTDGTLSPHKPCYCRKDDLYVFYCLTQMRWLAGSSRQRKHLCQSL